MQPAIGELAMDLPRRISEEGEPMRRPDVEPQERRIASACSSEELDGDRVHRRNRYDVRVAAVGNAMRSCPVQTRNGAKLFHRGAPRDCGGYCDAPTTMDAERARWFYSESFGIARDGTCGIPLEVTFDIALGGMTGMVIGEAMESRPPRAPDSSPFCRFSWSRSR